MGTNKHTYNNYMIDEIPKRNENESSFLSDFDLGEKVFPSVPAR